MLANGRIRQSLTALVLKKLHICRNCCAGLVTFVYIVTFLSPDDSLQCWNAGEAMSMWPYSSQYGHDGLWPRSAGHILLSNQQT